MRLRDNELSQGWGQIVTPLRVETEDGVQQVNCANTEDLFRIIQSIPSPKAEPFKRWLAQVGYERVKEIENPELASARARELYQAKGYPQAWIEKRLRSIAVRGELTDEWKTRGVQEGKEYSILTAEIARATFGVTPDAHSRLKGLDKVKTGNNLRDHMTDLELFFPCWARLVPRKLRDARMHKVLPITARQRRMAAPSPAMRARRYNQRLGWRCWTA